MSGWTVRLTHQAAQDIEDILHWTFERFGPLQMAAYADVINDALDALVKWPHLLDARRRPELGDDVATLHVARQGRKGRHLVVFRVYEKGPASLRCCASCMTVWICRDILFLMLMGKKKFSYILGRKRRMPVTFLRFQLIFLR